MTELFSCEKCNAVFIPAKDPKQKGNYPYSHVKCPCCKKAGGVYFKGGNARHNVISDQIKDGGIVSHGDGNFYDSKSTYYKMLKRKGLAISESSSVQSKKPESFNSVAFDRAFKKALEQHGY